MLNLITESDREEFVYATLDELAREGARQMIELALKLEVEEYLNGLKEEKDNQGKALVVRNGKSRPRNVTVGSSTMEIQSPRVNDKRPGKNLAV